MKLWTFLTMLWAVSTTTKIFSSISVSGPTSTFPSFIFRAITGTLLSCSVPQMTIIQNTRRGSILTSQKSKMSTPRWQHGSSAAIKSYDMTNLSVDSFSRTMKAFTLRCVFTLPQLAVKQWFSALQVRHAPPKYLGYVEWFTPFPASANPNHRLYKISKHCVHGELQASIVPVQLIRQSVHLFPKFGPIAPEEWKSSNVLGLCQTFFVNCFSDRFPYSNLFWLQLHATLSLMLSWARLQYMPTCQV